jgi:hypothetical protein
MQDIPIRDIKPLVEIEDYSIYLFYGFSLLGFIVFLSIAYFLFRYIKSKKSQSKREKYIEIISNIDFSNPKESAYKLTEYGRVLATDKRSSDIYREFIEKLEAYKYKKSVPDIDDEIKRHHRLFLEVLKSV